MREKSAGRETDRRIYFEIFLLCAALLALTARLPELHCDKPAQPAKPSTTYSYFWGRGEDGYATLFMSEKGASPLGIHQESLPEAGKLLLFQPMDINRISEELLQTVPGIGRELAARIIRRRTEVGGFSEMKELRRIDGIGGGKLRRLRRYLTVAAPRINAAGN